MYNPTCVSNGAGHKTPLIMNVTFEHPTIIFDDKIAEVIIIFTAKYKIEPHNKVDMKNRY